MQIKYVKDQLYGMRFSVTRRNVLLVEVKGISERAIKIKFF